MTIADLLALWSAFLLFPLVSIVPGYVILKWTDVLAFSKGHQLSKSLLASIALVPWFTYVLWRFTGPVGAGLFYAILWSVFGYWIIRLRGALFADLVVELRRPKVLIILALGLTVGSLMLVDIEVDGHLIRMQMSHDYVKHIAVTDAVSRTGIPPINPSFYPAESIQLFYYYFWFMFCSVVDLIGGVFVGPRAAVLAGTLWCGLAVVSLVHLFLDRWGARILPGTPPRAYRWGILLLLVTGLDITVVFFDWLTQNLLGTGSAPLINVEWWNDQIVSWLGTVLWVPHHMGSFIGCMLAFMLVVDSGGQRAGRSSWPAITIAAIALASALGMSIWVAIVAGFIMGAWIVVSWAYKEVQAVKAGVITSVLAVVLALPFVFDMSAANNLSRFPLDFTVRHFYKLHLVLAPFGEPVVSIGKFLALPINYGIELGFFALGGMLYWAYRKQNVQPLNLEERFLVTMLGATMLFCSFVRSAVVLNDLGWRGFLFVQFVLLLLTIPVMSRLMDPRGKTDFFLSNIARKVAVAMLVLSTCSMAYETFSLRFRYLGPSGAGTTDIRLAYEWVDAEMPQEAIVQHNPDYDVDYFHAQYGNRQVVVADRVYGMLYGVDEVTFDKTMVSVNRLFDPALSQQEGIRISQDLGIDALFVKESDEIWGTSEAWISDLVVLYENATCRIYEIPE